MLQHNKKGEKVQPNTFVDGVHVKISERYKPPMRVVLPVSCQNCGPGEALYSEYDFRLEESVLHKLAEWKSARREAVERRKERLKTETKVREEIEHFSNVSLGPGSHEGVDAPRRPPNHKLTDSVLTPVCAKQSSPSRKPVSSQFNFSDFESDNSSPFDNMELKTINDMEVLASILTANTLDQSLHNNNNLIFHKETGKNCLVLNNRNSEWGVAPLNGYSSIGYSDHSDHSDHSDYGNRPGVRTGVPAPQKDFNQFGFYPISEHNQISNYGLNDFSNQFGAAVSLDRAPALVGRQETNALGRNKASSVKEPQAREGLQDGCKGVPDIMLELERELRESREREEETERRNRLTYLKQTIVSSSIKDIRELPESSRKIHGGQTSSSLPDPTSSLSVASQKQAGYISELGFPLARVARAYEMFDGNDKKILEFLVQVQSLEEKNYPGDLVEKALVINKFRLTESLKYLEAMVVLLDLGFDEEKAEEALIAAGSDRDKALDMLIS